MQYLNLYRVCSYLLFLGLLGHTLGGMLGTAKHGLKAGASADEVLAKMKSVRFNWRGGKCTWFGFWFGNGLDCYVESVFWQVTSYTNRAKSC